MGPKMHVSHDKYRILFSDCRSKLRAPWAQEGKLALIHVVLVVVLETFAVYYMYYIFRF